MNIESYKFALSKRKNSYDEYVIRAYIDGKYNEDATYYTDDWEDAVGTLKSIAKQYDLAFEQTANGFVAKKSLSNESIRNKIESLENQISKLKETLSKNDLDFDDNDGDKFIALDFYDDADRPELLGFAKTFGELKTLCHKRIEDTDGECDLYYSSNFNKRKAEVTSIKKYNLE